MFKLLALSMSTEFQPEIFFRCLYIPSIFLCPPPQLINAVMNDENCRAPGAKRQIMYKQLLAQLQTDNVLSTCHLKLLLFFVLSFCARSLLFFRPFRFCSNPQGPQHIVKWLKDEEQIPGQYMVRANRVRPVA